MNYTYSYSDVISTVTDVKIVLNKIKIWLRIQV
jgi:hypothetical protein